MPNKGFVHKLMCRSARQEPPSDRKKAQALGFLEPAQSPPVFRLTPVLINLNWFCAATFLRACVYLNKRFMPQFSFKARKRSGELVQGVLEGPDRSAVLSQMERQGLLPISLEASKGKKGSTPQGSAGWIKPDIPLRKCRAATLSRVVQQKTQTQVTGVSHLHSAACQFATFGDAINRGS